MGLDPGVCKCIARGTSPEYSQCSGGLLSWCKLVSCTLVLQRPDLAARVVSGFPWGLGVKEQGETQRASVNVNNCGVKVD